MKNISAVLLCVTGLLAFGCAKAVKPDAAALQGTWTGQVTGNGNVGAPSLVLAGTNLEYHAADPLEWYKATYTLREDTNPKQLVAVITDCPLPEYVGKTTYAIYKIEDGTLTITASEPGSPVAPAGFDARGARKIVLTRK